MESLYVIGKAHRNEFAHFLQKKPIEYTEEKRENFSIFTITKASEIDLKRVAMWVARHHHDRVEIKTTRRIAKAILSFDKTDQLEVKIIKKGLFKVTVEIYGTRLFVNALMKRIAGMS